MVLMNKNINVNNSIIMSKFQIVHGIKIYPIEYLINEELSESDLSNLFDTQSLLYSIIIGMYRHISSKRKNSDIINNIKKDRQWLIKNKWTIKERDLYEQQLAKALKNIYYISDEIAMQKAQWYMIVYGFDIK